MFFRPFDYILLIVSFAILFITIKIPFNLNIRTKTFDPDFKPEDSTMSLLNEKQGVEASGTLLDKINILTYNFLLRPPGINNNGNDYKDMRIKVFTNSVVSFYDIVCMQEVFAYGSYRRQNLIDMAKEAGLPYSKASTQPCFVTGTDGGLLIMSRFPMVRTNELFFTKSALSDRFAYKGCLYARIQVRENFHFHIFNTHTQFSKEAHPPLSDDTVQVRLNQIAEIRKFIDENLINKPAEEPVFLMGDFNVDGRVSPSSNDSSSSPEYTAMYQILCEGGATEIKDEDPSNEKPLPFRNFKDLLHDRLGYHPITFGDVIETDEGRKIPREIQLTLPGDQLSCLSLDYIFHLDESKGGRSSSPNAFYRTEVNSTQVEEIFYDNPNSQFPCTQLSDHYGVSTQVLIRKA